MECWAGKFRPGVKGECGVRNQQRFEEWIPRLSTRRGGSSKMLDPKLHDQVEDLQFITKYSPAAVQGEIVRCPENSGVGEAYQEP